MLILAIGAIPLAVMDISQVIALKLRRRTKRVTVIFKAHVRTLEVDAPTPVALCVLILASKQQEEHHIKGVSR